MGRQDPTIDLRERAVAVAMHTPDGTAALRAVQTDEVIQVDAWGDGAAWALEQAPAALGLRDDQTGFEAHHEIVAQARRDHPGLRLPASGRILDASVRAVLSQRTTGFEARRAFRLLVERWGSPAPGPTGLLLPPPGDELAELPYYDLHVIGVEQRRADVLKRVGAHATRLDASELDPTALRERLEGVAGIGPWTSAEVARAALGDADAVSVGDYHAKHTVAWALAGEPRGTDDRMLELLEPYAGHRGRVCVLLDAVGVRAPRHGPRSRISLNDRR